MAKPENANGCYDRPPLERHVWVQDGWMRDHNIHTQSGTSCEVRFMRRIKTPWKDQCMYDNKITDPRCSGCKHQKE
jgi:hypothetical protein